MPKTKLDKRRLSAVSTAFIENTMFLKKFLTRYFSSRQDIEDVVQETYLRAYAAEQKKGIINPKAFLFRVAKNVALTKLTKKSRQITDYLDDLATPLVFNSEASIDEHVEAEELLGLYCEAVATLPGKYRNVFLLRKVHGLAHKEIAERLSISTTSVDNYLRRGTAACEAFILENEGRGVHAARNSTVPPAGKGQK